MQRASKLLKAPYQRTRCLETQSYALDHSKMLAVMSAARKQCTQETLNSLYEATGRKLGGTDIPLKGMYHFSEQTSSAVGRIRRHVARADVASAAG